MYKMILKSEYDNMVKEIKELRIERYKKDKSVYLSPVEKKEIIESEHHYKLAQLDERFLNAFSVLEHGTISNKLIAGRAYYILHDEYDGKRCALLDISNSVDSYFCGRYRVYYETEEDLIKSLEKGEIILLTDSEYDKIINAENA